MMNYSLIVHETVDYNWPLVTSVDQKINFLISQPNICRAFFFNISRTNSKTSKVTEQSVLNLYLF